jgi:hypothetical protein
MSDDKDRELEHQKRRMLADMRVRISRASDDIDRKAQSIAEAIAQKKIKQTQVRSLESLAVGTDKVSDLTDWLKKRIGRTEAWADVETGPELLAMLGSLRTQADEIADALKHYGDVWDRDLARRVHLQLCRELLRHLSAHYEYLHPANAKRGG